MQLEPVQSFVAILPTDGNSVPEACGRFLEGAKGHLCVSRGASRLCSAFGAKGCGFDPDKSKGDFHTLGPCKKAVFACLATDVKKQGAPHRAGVPRAGLQADWFDGTELD